jgi:signal peptidase
MFMQTTAGLIVCVIIPLILLVGFDLIRRRKHEQQNQQDTAALLKELEELRAQKKDKTDGTE